LLFLLCWANLHEFDVRRSGTTPEVRELYNEIYSESHLTSEGRINQVQPMRCEINFTLIRYSVQPQGARMWYTENYSESGSGPDATFCSHSLVTSQSFFDT
jgi:hypothetical protein